MSGHDRLGLWAACAALLAAPAASAAPKAGDAPNPAVEAVRKALDATIRTSYAYAVEGRFKRTGEFFPPDLLSARIDAYRSARRGDIILVKGPEGIWKTPAEHLGEIVTGRQPKDLADKIRVLEGAEPPHNRLREALDLADRGAADADADWNGIPCRNYSLSLSNERLRQALEEQIDREIQRGDTPKPDKVLWNTLRGTLRVHVDRQSGLLVRTFDERSVRLAFGTEEKKYRNFMTITWSGHGATPLDLPPEVKIRLGIADAPGDGKTKNAE
jgi:hypothetical protein